MLPVPLETQDSRLLASRWMSLVRQTLPPQYWAQLPSGSESSPLYFSERGRESSMKENSVGCLPHSPEGLRGTDVGAWLRRSVLRKGAGHWGWLVEVRGATLDVQGAEPGLETSRLHGHPPAPRSGPRRARETRVTGGGRRAPPLPCGRSREGFRRDFSGGPRTKTEGSGAGSRNGRRIGCGSLVVPGVLGGPSVGDSSLCDSHCCLEPTFPRRQSSLRGRHAEDKGGHCCPSVGLFTAMVPARWSLFPPGGRAH